MALGGQKIAHFPVKGKKGNKNSAGTMNGLVNGYLEIYSALCWLAFQQRAQKLSRSMYLVLTGNGLLPGN